MARRFSTFQRNLCLLLSFIFLLAAVIFHPAADDAWLTASRTSLWLQNASFYGNRCSEDISNIVSAADHGNGTLLCLVDMSAAFDTVDCSILLYQLGTSD